MNMGPYLVVRGAVFGSLLLILLCVLSTAGLQATDAAALAPTSIPNIGRSPDPPTAGSDACQLSASYPPEILQWCTLISQTAQTYDLAPNLIAAVILQESGGDPLAYSHSGAVGLMQVMPRDGLAASFTCANGPCFASRPTIQELQDPEFNIQYGTRLLASLYAHYGDLRQALKAYGPADAGYTYADIVLGIYERYQ
jgi:soluble lytic murein transglycosylase-like protein